MNILITGADGFVGKNLRSILQLNDNFTITTFNKSDSIKSLTQLTKDCDFVVHLAGVNRPQESSEFYEGNAGLTEQLCAALTQNKNTCPVLVSSSIQAERDNDYGKSKKQAEDALLKFSKKHGNPVYIYRFKNLFGKWGKPNYNSVVATWCYNVSRDIEITVNDPSTELELCYIDDVVDEIVARITTGGKSGYYEVSQPDTITLGELRDLLVSFKQSRTNYLCPNQSTRLYKNLYATYLHYLPADRYSYELKTHTDNRGSFTEILKDSTNGQVSINISKPGVTKGQHWHSTKNEKFLVISGEGTVQLRDIYSDEIIEYHVSGEKLEVVDIPTGYTHNIINRGESDLYTIIWANELFDPQKPDTNYQNV